MALRPLAYLGLLASSALAAWSLLLARDGSRAMEETQEAQGRILPLFQAHAQGGRAVAIAATGLLLDDPRLLEQSREILRSVPASPHVPALTGIDSRIESLSVSLARGARPSRAAAAALGEDFETLGAALAAEESSAWESLASASVRLLEYETGSARALRFAFLALSIGLAFLLWASARGERDAARARERERLQDTLFSSLEEGVLLCERDGTVLACNDAAGTLLGVPAASIRSKRLGSALPGLVREDGTRVPAGNAPPLERLSRGEPNLGSVIGLVRPNFRIRWLSVHSRPLDESGGPGPSVIRILDVTERVENRAIIDRQQTDLASKERFSAIGQMAGGIAHEINNPLAIIHADAEELLDLAAESDAVESSSARAVAGRIRGTAARIADIVRGIKAAAHAGPQLPRVETTLEILVRDALDLCRARIESAGVELQAAPVPAELSIVCRPTQITQVLVNLLGNACDAAEGSRRPWIALECADLGDHVRIAVTDGGAGLTPEAEGKIFTPLFTTKGTAKGTGLGLSISRGIVEDHGGTIRLDRDSAHTRFVVTLPKARAAQVRAAA